MCDLSHLWAWIREGNSPSRSTCLREELCLTVENGMVDVEGAEVSLMPCVSAIAAGDGRELFSLQPNGQLLSVLGKLCIGLAENV